VLEHRRLLPLHAGVAARAERGRRARLLAGGVRADPLPLPLAHARPAPAHRRPRPRLGRHGALVDRPPDDRTARAGSCLARVPGLLRGALARPPRAAHVSADLARLAAGCRWSPHGSSGEHVPGPDGALRPVPTLAMRPAFARRAFAADLATWHYSVPERLAARLPSDVAFIDWMAKRGATGLLFIRHANDTQWVIPELVPELRRRGLDVEGGGHVLVELLPRSLFATHPEYFPLAPDGRRSDLG